MLSRQNAKKTAKTQPLDNGWLTVLGAGEHNLQNVDAAFPLGCLTCVTGPSGSGKSTLVDDILRRALFREFFRSKDAPGAPPRDPRLSSTGQSHRRRPNANWPQPALESRHLRRRFGPIRDLFAEIPLSRQRGYEPGRFSFNVAGGRCETCQGDGSIKIDMHFLSDVYVTCETCNGRRYNDETLQVTYRGHSIADVLEMSIGDARKFFQKSRKFTANCARSATSAWATCGSGKAPRRSRRRSPACEVSC